MNMQLKMPKKKKRAKAKAARQAARERERVSVTAPQQPEFALKPSHGRIQSMAKIINISPQNAWESFSVGDVLKIGVFPYTHYGIYVGDGMVAHNSKRHGKVVLESYDDFAKGETVLVSDITSDKPYQAAINAMSGLGKPYDTFNFNCEHFVRDCHGLPPESNQKQKYLTTGAAFTIAARIPSPAGKAVFAAAGVAAALTSETEKPLDNAILAGGSVLALIALSKMLK